MKYLWIAGAALSLQSAAAVAAESIPLSAFVTHDAVSRLDISPDGRHLAMVVPRDHYIADYWWVRDDRLVIALASKPDGHEAPQA